MNKGLFQTYRTSIVTLGLGLTLGLTGCAEKRFEAFQNPTNPGTTGTTDPTNPGSTPTPTPLPPGSTPTPTPTPPGSTPTPTPTPSTPTPTPTPTNPTPSPTPTNPTPTPTPGCTTQVVESIYLNTKLIFVVDTSGSNKSESVNSKHESVPATDPNKAYGFRSTVLQNFVNRFRHKTNFDWGFTTFSADSSVALINNGNAQSPIFVNSPNVMDWALGNFRNQADGGNTPYGKALALAAKAISNDPDKNKTGNAAPTYFVIFVTDGFPTDYYKDVDSNGDGVIDNRDTEWQFQQGQMNTDLTALLNAAPGKVNLSTIFYGQKNDPVAIDLLKLMANRGKGQFANVNVTTSDFKIDDVIPGSEVCK